MSCLVVHLRRFLIDGSFAPECSASLHRGNTITTISVSEVTCRRCMATVTFREQSKSAEPHFNSKQVRPYKS